MDDFVTFYKTPSQYINLQAQTETASLLKLLQLKINKNPTEIASPDTLRLWDSSQRKSSPATRVTKIKMVLGSGEKRN